MTSTALCSDCQSPVLPTDISCSTCGKAIPFQATSKTPSSANTVNTSTNQHSQDGKPYLTTQIKDTYTSGEHIALDFSIHNTPPNTQFISASFSGPLSQTTNSKTFLANEVTFDSILPNIAGDIRLSIAITCQTAEYFKFTYQCSTTLKLNKQNFNSENPTYNISIVNEGVLDAERFIDQDKNNTDTTTPKYNLEEIPLKLIKKESLKKITRGKIIFHSNNQVKATHLYALAEIILGRQTEKKPVDIDLKCFPNNEDNQYRANRISRHHCIIRLQQQKFEIRDVSTWGTQINQTRIKKEEWHIINNNDIIQIADINVLTKELTGALQLKATTLPHGLLLERIDNAAQEENYLILKPETKPVPNHSNDSPIIFHHEGGFHLLSKNGQSHYLSIDKKINIDQSQFTFHNT